MSWFNKSEESKGPLSDNEAQNSLPLPASTNCTFNEGYEWNAWRMFCLSNRLEAPHVIFWCKLCVDYYKAILDDERVIFYDYLHNGIRMLNPEAAKFSTQLEWQKEFARRLLVAMDHKSINQKTLSELTGIPQSSLSYYISARKLPSAYTVWQLSNALQCSTDFLSVKT